MEPDNDASGPENRPENAPAFDPQTSLSAAVSYPLSGPGRAVLVAIAAMALVPYGGVASWIVSLYFVVRTMQAVARGARRMPDLPSSAGLGEHAELWGRAVAVTAMLFFPALLFIVGWELLRSPDFRGSDAYRYGLMLLAFFGAFASFASVVFLPVALGAVAQGDSALMAVLPPRLRAYRKRMGAGFAVAQGVLWLGGFGLFMAQVALDRLPLVASAISRGASFYWEMVLAYAVGASLWMPPVPAVDESQEVPREVVPVVDGSQEPQVTAAAEASEEPSPGS